jgi:hypothetical protein
VKSGVVWLLIWLCFRIYGSREGLSKVNKLVKLSISVPEQTEEYTNAYLLSILAPLIERFWDFGGQQAYRATHQFFFSSDALYLVVWNARAGQDKDDVAGWLNRILQRVGDRAKAMLVATHSDTVEPCVLGRPRGSPRRTPEHALARRRSGSRRYRR